MKIVSIAESNWNGRQIGKVPIDHSPESSRDLQIHYAWLKLMTLL